MRTLKAAVVLVAGVAVLIAAGTTQAAGTVSMSRVVGSYRLMLQTGPIMMSSMATMSGAMTVGGKPATCRSNAAKVQVPMCNHHVGLHVFDAKTNHIVLRAHVVIVLRNMQKHTTMMVPIGMMMGSAGLRDYQYGNDIAAASGRYSVAVTVNGVHTTFSVQLK